MGQYYCRLTVGEGNQFYALRKAQIPMVAIAVQLSRSRTTLYNELNRNTGGRGYRPKQAQTFAEQRRAEKVGPLKLTPPVVAYIDAQLGLQWSPEQIADALKMAPDRLGLTVSHETIYQHIWNDKRVGGMLYHLLCSRIFNQESIHCSDQTTARW